MRLMKGRKYSSYIEESVKTADDTLKFMTIPEPLSRALDALRDAQDRQKVKHSGIVLTETLKKISRSEHRGGLNPNYNGYDVGLRREGNGSKKSKIRPLRGKRRQLERNALFELSNMYPATNVEELINSEYYYQDGDDIEELTEAGQFMKGFSTEHLAILKATQEESDKKALWRNMSNGRLYDDSAAFAYAVARLPGCFAAIEHVLKEIKRIAPADWYPRTFLDFGAGLASGAWAAHRVWYVNEKDSMNDGDRRIIEKDYKSEINKSDGLEQMRGESLTKLDNTYHSTGDRLRVTAVEPSGHMIALGERLIKEARATEKQQASNISENSKTGTISAAKYLDRFPNIFWTPKLFSKGDRRPQKGHDIVLAAYVFGEIPDIVERRKILRQLWKHTDHYLVLIEPGTPSGFANIEYARSYILNLSKSEAKESEPKAHVAAPCPHDGPCPLAGKRIWCHFQQKFHVSGLQRWLKSSLIREVGQKRNKASDRGNYAKSHQDERFSYVVLAKAPRPSPKIMNLLDVVENFESRANSSTGQTGASIHPGSKKSNALKSNLAFEEDSNDSVFSFGEKDAVKEGPAENGDSFPSGKFLMNDQSLEADNAIQELRRVLAETEGKTEAEGGISEFSRLALQELLMDLEEDMEDCNEEVQDNADEYVEGDDVEQKSKMEIDSLVESSDYSSSDSDSDSSTSDSDSSVGDHGLGSREDLDTKFNNHEEGHKSSLIQGNEYEKRQDTIKVGTGWSRLIRQPRKRSRHVIVDLCSAHDANGYYLGGKKGQIVKHIVSKASSVRYKDDQSAYKLARKARWGDRWPVEFQLIGKKSV